MVYTTDELKDFFVICFTNPSFDKNTINSYEVLEAPLDKVPLYLNDPKEKIRELAKWRLEHNK